MVGGEGLGERRKGWKEKWKKRKGGVWRIFYGYVD